MTISDGAIITNTAACYLAYTGQKNIRLALSGESQLHLGGAFGFSQTQTSRPDDSSSNIVEVTEGSIMAVGGKFQWDNPSSPTWADALDGYYDYVIVDGEGSSLKLQASDIARFRIKGGAAMIVRNNGALDAKTLVLGWKYTRNNLLRVESHGTTSVSSVFMSGYGASNNSYMSLPDATVDGLRNNRVEVLDGGTLEISGTFCMAYEESQSGNMLVTLMSGSRVQMQCLIFPPSITMRCSAVLTASGMLNLERSSCPRPRFPILKTVCMTTFCA